MQFYAHAALPLHPRLDPFGQRTERHVFLGRASGRAVQLERDVDAVSANHTSCTPQHQPTGTPRAVVFRSVERQPLVRNLFFLLIAA